MNSIKEQAIKLRNAGYSYSIIKDKIGVSKSSASIWCRDILLTSNQIRELNKNMVRGAYEGRLKGARVQHERRVKAIHSLLIKGKSLVKNLSHQDILLIGAALYWGEGMKKEGRARLVNSDPRIIKFMMMWLWRIWNIPKQHVSFHVMINHIHKKRVPEVEAYWANQLNVSRGQFTKTVLIKSKNKKVYKNFTEHYGTLTISVQRGGDLRHLIIGLIDGIAEQATNLPT